MPASCLSRRELATRLLGSGRITGHAPRTVIALPARDEEDRIAGCLSALIGQRGGKNRRPDFGIVLLANNCRDATAPIARRSLKASGIPHLVAEIDLAPGRANAGFARGLAMDMAGLWAERAPSPGILLTTDADTCVGDDWIERNLADLAAGCGAVAGRFAFDRQEEQDWPAHLRQRHEIETAYELSLAALSAWLDPLPHDPWPNHWTESGASFALTLAAYRRIGGLPPVDVGEDRALAAALERHDIGIRHDPAIIVTTSARFDGRAHGGCATTLRRRGVSAQALGDDRLEALPAALRRMMLRGRLRRAFDGHFRPDEWERRLGLPLGTLTGRTRFGEAWSVALAASPLLVPRPLRPAAMARHLAAARQLLAALERASAQREQIQPIIRRALLGQQVGTAT